jgi:hypothetical protein
MWENGLCVFGAQVTTLLLLHALFDRCLYDQLVPSGDQGPTASADSGVTHTFVHVYCAHPSSTQRSLACTG